MIKIESVTSVTPSKLIDTSEKDVKLSFGLATSENPSCQNKNSQETKVHHSPSSSPCSEDQKDSKLEAPVKMIIGATKKVTHRNLGDIRLEPESSIAGRTTKCTKVTTVANDGDGQATKTHAASSFFKGSKKSTRY